MADKDRLNKIYELVTVHCDACQEFEPEKSSKKFDCLYCNYGIIKGILNSNDEKEYSSKLKKENKKLKTALSKIKDITKEISYLGSKGERVIKFKIENILEKVLDE